jgi:hypothetical protein
MLPKSPLHLHNNLNVNLTDRVVNDVMVDWMRETRKAYIILVKKPFGKRPVQREKERCKDNI